MKTLLLDLDQWDTIVDSQGNIAVADYPYALAQDVASAIKLFLGELWYDTSKGVPYFKKLLGKPLSPPLLQHYLSEAALTVPGVVSALAIIESFSGRVVTGQVQFTDDKNNTNTVTFSNA